MVTMQLKDDWKPLIIRQARRSEAFQMLGGAGDW